MKEWKNPQIEELAVEYTEGDTQGTGEDHIKIANPMGWDIWGSNS